MKEAFREPDVRISTATYLMQATDLSVIQIVYEVGFVEWLTFKKKFKKHTGMTPLQFKKSVRPK